MATVGADIGDDYLNYTYAMPSAASDSANAPGFWGTVGDGFTKVTNLLQQGAATVAGVYGQVQDFKVAREINKERATGIKNIVRAQSDIVKAQMPSITDGASNSDYYGGQVASVLGGAIKQENIGMFLLLGVGGFLLFRFIK